jgi:hypothetical protein
MWCATLLRALAKRTKITGVYNHGSCHLDLPPLMLVARNFFERVPVLFEAPQITVPFRSRRLDFFKRSMCHQDIH